MFAITPSVKIDFIEKIIIQSLNFVNPSLFSAMESPIANHFNRNELTAFQYSYAGFGFPLLSNKLI